MVPAEDYDLWLRLLPRHRFAKISDRLYHYRLHPFQTGAQSRQRQTERSILAKLEYLRGKYPTLPAQARLALAGSSRGTVYYAKAAPHAGFAIAGVALTPDELRTLDWNVAAITEFAGVDAYRRAFCQHRSDVEALGNFLVRLSASSTRH
jgi:hypothetical protein